MSFTSSVFFIFILILFLLYWLVKKVWWQNAILLFASYLFYSWVNPWLGLLLGLSTIVDYLISGRLRFAHDRKKVWLAFSLIANLGILGLFKYFNFFSENISSVLQLIGFETEPLILNFVLPVGISFFTLKKLSYIIDVYKRTPEKYPTLVDFALYVSFFPQIIAGPIDRHQKLLPQISRVRIWSSNHFYKAIQLLVFGFFKKIVIADSITIYVNKIFSLQQPGKMLLYVGALAFTLQILADFSGYVDISRGLAYLFGFETNQNFNAPYLSLTPTDFWNRWHITLSNWLRDYVFFPIRRALLKKRGKIPWLTLALPPLITMFISGFWHGAGWTYVLWGLYYGVLIVLYQQAGMGGNWKPKSKNGYGLAWMVMFNLIVFGWALFRASSIRWLGNILFHAPAFYSPDEKLVALIVLLYTIFYSIPLIIKYVIDNYFEKVWILKSVFLAGALIAIIVFINSSSPDFIYVQF